MTYRIATILFAAAVVLSPAIAGAADGDSDRTRAKTYVKDSAITTSVKTKLAEEKVRTLLDIKVDTDSNGEVTLSGNVANQAEADRAVAIARGVSGVATVKNDLTIKTAK